MNKSITTKQNEGNIKSQEVSNVTMTNHLKV